jgi:hypothetical protein
MKTSYYTPGNPKRKRHYEPEWFKKISLKAYTSDEWQERFKTMTVKEQFDFIKVFIPKQVEIDSSNTFQLIIKGLEPMVLERKLIESKALDEHQDNDDPVDR